MTHETASKALTEILRDGYGRPAGAVAYVYCAGVYAVALSTNEGNYVLQDIEAVCVYRTTHRGNGGK